MKPYLLPAGVLVITSHGVVDPSICIMPSLSVISCFPSHRDWSSLCKPFIISASQLECSPSYTTHTPPPLVSQHGMANIYTHTKHQPAVVLVVLATYTVHQTAMVVYETYKTPACYGGVGDIYSTPACCGGV